MQTISAEAPTDEWTSIVFVPRVDSTVDDVVDFSHTFDAYGIHGSLERISMISDAVWDAWLRNALSDCELDELRTALFMSQSQWRRNGDDGDRTRMGYEWELVEAIRETSGGLVSDHRPIML